MPNMGTATAEIITAPTVTGDSQIWTVWNQEYTSATVSTGSSIITPNDASLTQSTTATGSNSQIWTVWVQNGSSGSTTMVESGANDTTLITATTAGNQVWQHWARDYRISNEEFQRREAQREENRQRAIRAEGERAAARERAQQLLHDNLNEEQRAELADKGHFHLTSIDKDGRRRKYRIKRGYQQNIHEIDDGGREINTICAHPRMRVPDEDAMLIQKLMLESPDGHEDFLKIANIAPRHH